MIIRHARGLPERTCPPRDHVERGWSLGGYFVGDLTVAADVRRWSSMQLITSGLRRLTAAATWQLI